MMQFEMMRVTLPLKKTFAISQGSVDVKTNLLVVLNNRYSGEAATSVYYGPTINELEIEISKGIAKLKEFEKLDLDVLKQINKFEIHSIARSALTAMVLNYISGETKRYPWEILSLGTPVGIKSSFTISIESPHNMDEAIAKCSSPILKIKMGSDDDDLIIEMLKKHKGKDFRIDVNGGWEPEKAEKMISLLGEIGVTIIEQPTNIKHISDWPMLKGKDSKVELFVDEGLERLSDYEAVAESIDGVNIKMGKSGGIIEAQVIAQAARKDGKKIMLGCMVETSVGVAQSVYMSSLADYHDLDGPLHLEADIAHGIRYDNEQIEVDREIIGGPILIRDVVDKFINK